MVHTVSEPIEVAVPAEVHALDLLGRVDYEDAYEVETASDRTPEEWMRAFVEGAPKWFTVPWIAVLGAGLLGVDPRVVRERRRVLGWKILRDDPDVFVVGLDTPRGLNARLIALRPPGRAIIATQIRLDTRYARALFPAIRRGHRYFAPYLLGVAAPQSQLV